MSQSSLLLKTVRLLCLIFNEVISVSGHLDRLQYSPMASVLHSLLITAERLTQKHLSLSLQLIMEAVQQCCSRSLLTNIHRKILEYIHQLYCFVIRWK